MKLYYAKGACSLAVHILLKELNINCELVRVNLTTKQTDQGEDFKTVNPKGAVPTLLLSDGTVLTENAIIEQYLVDTFDKGHQLLAPIGAISRYQTLMWLNYASTEMHKSCSPLFNSEIPTEIKETIFLPALNKKIEFINERLAEQTYLAGPKVSLADFYAFTVLTWCPHLGIRFDAYPHVKRYFDLIKARPAVQQAFEEEGL